MRYFHLMLLAIYWLAPATQAAEPQIKWRVEAGFAPFEYAANSDELMQAWAKISEGDYATWAASLESTPGLVSPLASLIVGPNHRSPWDPKTGQYERRYVHPTHTVIRASLVGGTGMCEWQLSGQAALPPRPCGEDTRIVDVPLAGATLAVRGQDGKQFAPVSISIEHVTILALGDSYASGEGNPDVPTVWKAGGVETGQLKWLRTAIDSDAQWWDNACHRSFWSSQTLVAVKIAASNPHRLVTYLQYSCSGSEVLDGMLTRQNKPPGLDNVCSGKACVLPSSQLAAAVRDLCKDETVAVSTQSDFAKKIHAEVFAKDHGLYRVESYNEGRGLDLVKCPDTPAIPDLVLLSIGGNDAGFAQLAGWAIAPDQWTLATVGRLVKGGMVCPEGFSGKRDGCKEPYDTGLARQVEKRFELLALALREVLPVPAGQIVQSTYPDPMLTSTGKVCADKRGSNPDGPWLGAAYRAPWIAPGRSSWHFNITEDSGGSAGEARILSGTTLPRMISAIEAGIRTQGYVEVDLHRAFTDHGWCDPPAGDPPIALPSFATNQESWRCAASPDAPSPACWAAYAPSKRFIRTMNDALLTQASRREDGHTGAIHPNLGGHATMADLIFERVARATNLITEPHASAGASP